MSVFDYPRINVFGTVTVNPGTANNDDYAASDQFPADWNAVAGEALGLIDSKNVKARTFGMSDDNFLSWAQKAQTFDKTDGSGTSEIIPAEWNFYGDMSMDSASLTVVGTDAGSSGVDLSGAMGATLTFSGAMTDINPEGSPPATQFFLETLTLGPTGAPLIEAALSKGVGQWINFFRNVNITADGGAGSLVYHALRDATVNLPGWDALGAVGVVFRYYLYRAQLVNPDNGGNEAIEQLYQQGQTNPKELQLVGTFAPLYDSEEIVSVPTGRLLTWDTPNITTPTSHNNGGGTVALGPGVVHRNGATLSADFSGTFPDNYNDSDGTNPKFDFGAVTLVATDGAQSLDVGVVDYANTDQGNAQGWLFDFTMSADVQTLMDDPATTLKLVSQEFGDVLAEVDYYFVSNQQAVYAEQDWPGDSFLNHGTNEPATVAVYHRGQALTAANCPPITVWQYRSVPLQSPGDAVVLSTSFVPGEPIVVDTAKPGNLLLTFTINDGDNPPPQGYPPQNYGSFSGPPWVTNAPQLSIRVLPNEDYQQYFVDPNSAEPVGNELLTFDIVYENVLQVYYLLYPVMAFLPLNSPEAVAGSAQKILDRTDPAIWMSKRYMPRTRDLSNSRRRLLHAWCRMMLNS